MENSLDITSSQIQRNESSAPHFLQRVQKWAGREWHAMSYEINLINNDEDVEHVFSNKWASFGALAVASIAITIFAGLLMGANAVAYGVVLFGFWGICFLSVSFENRQFTHLFYTSTLYLNRAGEGGLPSSQLAPNPFVSMEALYKKHPELAVGTTEQKYNNLRVFFIGRYLREKQEQFHLSDYMKMNVVAEAFKNKRAVQGTVFAMEGKEDDFQSIWKMFLLR